MITPSFEKLQNIVADYDRITFYKEVAGDIFTPVSLLKSFSNEKYLVLLESSKLDKTFSRFSFFSKSPKNITLFKGNSGDPISYLSDRLKVERVYSGMELGDFTGGYVGFLGYESVNYINILRGRVKESSDDNISGFMEIDTFYVFDNYTNKLFAACNLKVTPSVSDLYKNGEDTLNHLIDELFNKKNEYSGRSEIVGELNFEKEYNRDDFIAIVNNIKGDIVDGEVIQTVFSEKFTLNHKINPISFYRAIRNINPSPYLFYLKFDDFVLLGSSPETHLKVERNVATLKPIAGTYPISENIDESCYQLLNDEKELAEHLMLLDLARNDLYQGCQESSVEVVKGFTTEQYSHVIHIVSEVKGVLMDDVTPFQLFCKTFPAGTVSGAPKVRAIELIDKYESSTRGFYAGCIGYFGFDGNLDTCITIRSALVEKDKVVLRAGAGIVADSIPDNELKEVERKLGAMFKAFEVIKNLEENNVFIS